MNWAASVRLVAPSGPIGGGGQGLVLSVVAAGASAATSLKARAPALRAAGALHGAVTA
jgi:hypothetical protein